VLPLDKRAALEKMMMPFSVDYAPAIPFWAHYTNYRRLLNVPKGWVLHTPQEPADSWAYTPRYFAEPNRDASTHYFVSYDGDVYQCVPDRFMAIANGVIGKPYSSWASAAQSLNRQALSVEIEGYAESIHETMPVGSRQWVALVKLLKDRAEAYGFPFDRIHTIGHSEVASNRSDPGARFPWAALFEEEDEMKPFLAWNIDNKSVHLIGPFGSAWITQASDVAALEKLYGPMAVALRSAAIDALRRT